MSYKCMWVKKYTEIDNLKHCYRITDWFVQVALLILWAHLAAFNEDLGMTMYCVVAGWFIGSLTVHFIISTKKFENIYRTLANICVFIVAFSFYGFAIVYAFIIQEYLLQLAIPLLAIFYACVCFAEILHVFKNSGKL